MSSSVASSLALPLAASAAAVFAAYWLLLRDKKQDWSRKRESFKLKRCAAPREAGVVYLYIFPRWKHSPSASPFCLRLETFLRMAGIPYEVTYTNNGGPKGKWPYVELDGEVLSDSGLIIEELMRRRLGRRSVQQPSPAGHALDVMLAERTYWGVVHLRWVREENREVLWRDLLPVPLPIRWLLSWTLVPQTRCNGEGHGLFRHDEETIDAFARSDLAAASGLLSAQPYVQGDAPSPADAMLFALLTQYLCDDFKHPLGDVLRADFPNLVAYHERLRTLFWPDWDTLLEHKRGHRFESESSNAH